MALKRSSLEAMGLSEQQIQSVIDMHTDTVNALKEKIDAAESGKEASDKLKADYDKLKADYDTIKQTVADNAKYKEQYETTKAEYEKFKTDTETKAAKAAADATFTKWLRENGYTEKGAAKIVKYGGFTPEFNKDGTIKNADKLSESVSAEWPEYKAKEHVEGAKTETPPANTGGNTITREDILKIPNTAERQKAIAENGALFGIK